MQAEAQLSPVVPLRRPPEHLLCHLSKPCKDAHRYSVHLTRTIDKENQVRAEFAVICTHLQWGPVYVGPI